jgi:hypothetical protein
MPRTKIRNAELELREGEGAVEGARWWKLGRSPFHAGLPSGIRPRGGQWVSVALCGLALAGWCGSGVAAESAKADGAGVAVGREAKPAASVSYYQKSRGYRAEPEPDPPTYVRSLSRTYEQFKDIDWLDVGLDFRTRYENRENDYRPWLDTRNPDATGAPVPRRRDETDDLWLTRLRAYVGVKNILDPFRFAVEYQDSRSFNGLYEPSNGEVNRNEFITGYGELFFRSALGRDAQGNDRPLSVRLGRMHLELLDRRLIGDNQFRNTTNTFDGLRVQLGGRDNDLHLDAFAFHPVRRLLYEVDRADWNTWVYGAVLNIRSWSRFATLQPYYLGRIQQADPASPIAASRVDRNVQSPGLRVYGATGKTGVDYDVHLIRQFGSQEELRTAGGQTVPVRVPHDAFGYSLEGGYTFDHAWKPRFSLYYGYGSGDRARNDGGSQRLDAFYGFNQPWSRHDYFAWDNLRAPKMRLEFSPHETVRIDTAVNAYWLASATDGWNRAGLRDASGQSGTYLGHEFDVRLRHKLGQFVEWTLSYAHFQPGGFTESFAATTGGLTGRPSRFFYLEVSFNAFGDGTPIKKAR